MVGARCLCVLTRKNKVVVTMDKFDLIRSALEEHLESINENTTEIQALFDFIQEVEQKIDKLSARLDQTQIKQSVEVPQIQELVKPLNQVEKEIFLVFYTENLPLSYDEISQRARIPVSTVKESISTLISKGLPLLRSFINTNMFYKLSPSFKERQAKENVINLSLESFMR